MRSRRLERNEPRRFLAGGAPRKWRVPLSMQNMNRATVMHVNSPQWRAPSNEPHSPHLHRHALAHRMEPEAVVVGVSILGPGAQVRGSPSRRTARRWRSLFVGMVCPTWSGRRWFCDPRDLISSSSSGAPSRASRDEVAGRPDSLPAHVGIVAAPPPGNCDKRRSGWS